MIGRGERSEKVNAWCFLLLHKTFFFLVCLFSNKSEMWSWECLLLYLAMFVCCLHFFFAFFHILRGDFTAFSLFLWPKQYLYAIRTKAESMCKDLKRNKGLHKSGKNKTHRQKIFVYIQYPYERASVCLYHSLFAHKVSAWCCIPSEKCSRQSHRRWLELCNWQRLTGKQTNDSQHQVNC